LEEIEADCILRAFDVTLRNVSAQPVRLRELFIGQPAPPAADIPLLASTDGCYGIQSGVKCARD
jgi:hypothetical protein